MMKSICVFIFCFWISASLGAPEYAAIDKYACEAPELQSENRLGRLVQYLVKPYKKDAEKARALLAWIVCHIDYDAYRAKTYENNANPKVKQKEGILPYHDILKTRLGSSEEIARLYQKMAQYARLKAEVVYGKAAKNFTVENLEFGAGHAWNAIKIDGEWQYVDPTWALGEENKANLGDIRNHKEYKQQLKARARDKKTASQPRPNRAIREEWFLTDKEKMIQTHFPNYPKWQLQKKELSKADLLGLTEREYKNELKKISKEREREKRRKK